MQPSGDLCLPPARVVLDTNVCLDLLLFRDPSTALLAQLLEQRRLFAVCNPTCRAEWHRVLEYSRLGLDPSQRELARTEYDRLLQPCIGAIRPAIANLPRCADPDDQIFLELAQASGARLLLTRDAALLALSSRTLRISGFRILPPQALESALPGLA